jgi:subtilisin family serine protease
VSHRIRVAALLALSLAFVAPVPAGAAAPTARQSADGAAYGGRLIVVWKVRAPAAVHISGVKSTKAMERPLRSVVTATAGHAKSVAAALRADPRVLAVVPDAKFSLTDWPTDGSPSDTLFGSQDDLAQIGVPEAWKTTLGDPSVVVAVIDSGVDLTHPDLDGVTVVSPRNTFWNNADVTDGIGHGTHVTGTILAETNNGEGVAGIAPASSLMPIKVADDQSFLSFSDVLDGVDWAREHGADVINMSLGGSLTPEQVALGQPTFTAARDAGILMVAAAGNSATDSRFYPASFAGVVSVNAVDGQDNLAAFSTTGKAIDLAAPGVDLVSTLPGGIYEAESGTSMSSPHVAGVAALVWAARPNLAVNELEAVLRASAKDLGDAGHDLVFGDGRVDAAAALVEPVPDPIPNLEPPAPLPALTIEFLAPTDTVRQLASTYTVRLAVNHEIVDSVAFLGAWPMVRGACNFAADPTVTELEFGPVIELTGLRPGFCYEVAALAVDEDGNFAEAISPDIEILDLTVPRIVSRTPGAGASNVSRASNVKVRFSESVTATSSNVRLRNLHTGLIVRVVFKWSSSTKTVTLDPRLLMYPHTRYRVEVLSSLYDRGGNRVKATSWTFTTGS